MNSQTIQDSVNKYRYGVLIGNYNEETFGTDLSQIEHKSRQINSTQKATHNLASTIYNVENQEVTSQEKEFNNLVTNQSVPLKTHLLFGHGACQNDFEKRQMTTSYDLSYNRTVKPQIQIYSKYEPGQNLVFNIQEYTLQANIPKKVEVTDKVNHITPSDPEVYKQPKQYIHYDEFMKTFDANHIKIPLRK